MKEYRKEEMEKIERWGDEMKKAKKMKTRHTKAWAASSTKPNSARGQSTRYWGNNMDVDPMSIETDAGILDLMTFTNPTQPFFSPSDVPSTLSNLTIGTTNQLGTGPSNNTEEDVYEDPGEESLLVDKGKGRLNPDAEPFIPGGQVDGASGKV